MKKHISKPCIAVFVIHILSACQSLTQMPLPTQTAMKATATAQAVIEPTETSGPATEAPAITPTLISVTQESLAGLIISSPILGLPYEVPRVEPPTTITPNGLGIINSEGRLIKFSDAGLFVGFSPSGVQLVYQHGFEDEYTDYIDNLYVYNAMTGETTEIIDDLEHEGGKRILSWSQDEGKFIYYNDYETVLFEAWGYFGARQLLLADVTTGKATRLIREGYQFDVSPDQTQIAYATGKLLDTKTNEEQLRSFGCFQPHIYNINTASSQAFDVSQLNEKPVCLGYPQWSLDGKKIAWMGYFEDDTFRPVVFNLEDAAGRIYDPLDQKPQASHLPTDWSFGEPPFGGYSDPNWIDNSIFWTPSYEVNVETDETSIPREINLPYYYRRDKYLKSPDGLFNVSLNEARDAIILTDRNGNLLTSFVLEDLYDGPKQEILTSPFFLPGRTNIIGWSPFSP